MRSLEKPRDAVARSKCNYQELNNYGVFFTVLPGQESGIPLLSYMTPALSTIGQRIYAAAISTASTYATRTEVAFPRTLKIISCVWLHLPIERATD